MGGGGSLLENQKNLKYFAHARFKAHMTKVIKIDIPLCNINFKIFKFFANILVKVRNVFSLKL